MKPSQLEDLASSIRNQGIMQPIVVRPVVITNMKLLRVNVVGVLPN
jgi:ParB family chromosome partitioning protein